MTAISHMTLKPFASKLTFLRVVKVLNLTASIAGPYATQLLADLGATAVNYYENLENERPFPVVFNVPDILLDFKPRIAEHSDAATNDTVTK